MAQQVKLAPLSPISPIGTGSNPNCSTSSPVPCYGILEGSGIWSKYLGPCAKAGDLEGALGSWAQPGPILTAAVIWGMHEQMFSLSLSLCSSAFQVNQNKSFKNKQTNKKGMNNGMMDIVPNKAHGTDNMLVPNLQRRFRLNWAISLASQDQ